MLYGVILTSIFKRCSRSKIVMSSIDYYTVRAKTTYVPRLICLHSYDPRPWSWSSVFLISVSPKSVGIPSPSLPIVHTRHRVQNRHRRLPVIDRYSSAYNRVFHSSYGARPYRRRRRRRRRMRRQRMDDYKKLISGPDCR